MEKRINWIDCYKAIAILMVVVGHATGRFNSYIYQFHVAAFFFISGYVSKIDRKSMDEIVIVKFFNLIVPYIFFSTSGLFLFAIFQKFGVLYRVSTFAEIPAFTTNIKTMFNALYCDWLGATWFLISLYASYILSKIILFLDQNKPGIIYLLGSFFVFCSGYYMNRIQMNFFCIPGMPKFFIIQFYFSLGFIASYWSRMIKVKNIFFVVIVIFNIAMSYLIKTRLLLVMDLVSLQVNSPLTDAFSVCNGVMLIWGLSHLIDSYAPSIANRIFSYLGKNTMGILIFHFLGFKLTTIFLLFFGIGKVDDISLLCPQPDISYVFWPLYASLTIVFSCFCWWGINKSQWIRFIDGIETTKYKGIYLKYRNTINKWSEEK